MSADDQPTSGSEPAGNVTSGPAGEGNLTGGPAANDPQPNPEPPVPSLSEPDPGVFHHAPAKKIPGSQNPEAESA